MRLSSYFKFRLPEGSDPVNVEDFNENFEEIDTKLNEVANKAGDVSKGTVFTETAKSRENLASGDTMATIIGKLMRWLADLGTAAFCGVANNDNTEAAGYVADARVLKTHKTALDKHEEELGGLYFGTDGNGKWGFKTSKNGAVTAFRKPAGNASVGDVLSGKTFANASNDSLTGTMPNRGAWTGETTGNENVAIPAGYHNGSGYVSGAGAYNAGVAAADSKVNKESASYKDGYNEGYMSFLGGSTISNTICTDFGGNVGAGLQYDPLWTERKFDETNTFEIPKKYNGGTLYALDVTVKHSGMETYGQAYSASGSYKLMNYDGTDIAAGSYDTTGQDVDYVNIDFMSKPYDTNGDVLKMLIKASGRVRLETSMGGNEWARATMQFTVVAKYKVPKA